MNDTRGHLVGDAVLAAVVGTVRGVIGADTAFGRLGGEEFALLLPGADRTAAAAVAERVRRAVADGPCAGVAVTVSLGVAVAPEDGAGPLQLLAAADAALYAAKRRNRVAEAVDLPRAAV